MKTLVDTNVLVRSIQRSHTASRLARRALILLLRQNVALTLAPQNVAEFWNVCTRPIEANGLGLNIPAANRHTEQLERLFEILHDSDHTFSIWRELVVTHSVSGVKVHDARLVATMIAHGIPQILTFNVTDFSRFDRILAVHPQDIG